MSKMAPKAAPKEIKKEELKKEVLLENISIEERAKEFEMTVDQIKEIDEVFNTFAKKDKSGKKVPNA